MISMNFFSSPTELAQPAELYLPADLALPGKCSYSIYTIIVTALLGSFPGRIDFAGRIGSAGRIEFAGRIGSAGEATQKCSYYIHI